MRETVAVYPLPQVTGDKIARDVDSTISTQYQGVAYPVIEYAWQASHENARAYPRNLNSQKFGYFNCG